MGDKYEVSVTLDGQSRTDITELGIAYGLHDITKPDDRVHNDALNGRKSYRMVVDGKVYTGKAARYDWQPKFKRGDVEVFPVIIETLDEWPNPCECCGASHDTLDC